VRKLFLGQPRDIAEIDRRVIPRNLCRACASNRSLFSFGPFPVPDTFGIRASQRRAPR
jgi:hypothetical protein